MPLPMVHLAVARKITKDFNKINNLSLYYLGAIAPDAIHMRKNQVPEDKQKSHLYSRNIQGIDNVNNYYAEKNNCLDRNFLLGYCIHVLTDIYWHETLYSSFKHKYSQDSEPIQEQKWAYYNDTDKLDFELYKTLEWKDEVWSLLKEVRGIDVEDLVTSTEVDAWNTRTLNWYNSGQSQHKNPIRYITSEDLMEFIDKSASDILKWVYQIG
jgi:hypothetical protein